MNLKIITAIFAVLLLSFIQAESAELINGGFETAGASLNEALNWKLAKFCNKGHVRVRSPRKSGSWSLKLQNTSADDISCSFQKIVFNQQELKPILLTGFIRGNVKKTPNGFFGATLYVEIHLVDGTIVYWNSAPNFGSFAWREAGINLSSIYKVTGPIAYVNVIPLLMDGTGAAYFDNLVIREFEPREAAVTLMFDDGHESAFNVAKPVLDAYGLCASAAVVTGEIDKPDSMTTADLQELENDCWSISSHSETHAHLDDIPIGKARNEMINSKKTLKKKKIEAVSFAYPFGDFNGALFAECQKHYVSCRGVNAGVNPTRGLYPHDVKTRVVKNTTTLGDVWNWLSEAWEKKAWVVIVFHVIADDWDDAYHTPVSDFEEMADLVANSGLDVITYDEGVRRYSVGKP
ncbi:polysaccharide deacetylase family protein [Candidatus Giovannonibacteria bacterium]|nr:polysaccharide deacetylase family protein [Candidatus Giovannonibacteria bacterium]